MNQIICNDALTALKDIDDNSVDIVLTSPPYNFDMQYDEHDDKDDAHKYIAVSYTHLTLPTKA